MIDVAKYVPNNIMDKFEFYNYNHAIEIITQAFPTEWKDVLDMLDQFHIDISDLAEAGGSETKIPGKFEQVLYPRKWRNVKIAGDLNLRFYERVIDQKRYSEHISSEYTLAGYITDQHIDFLKGRIALGIEWNKKDISFDRVLASMRTCYECGLISAGIIVTRSGDLADAFRVITDESGQAIFRKYGSSSTWIGKLLPRLDSRLAGGCPILVIGIRKNCIEGLN